MHLEKMPEAEAKTYRRFTGSEDMHAFELKAGESDLLIEIPKRAWNPEIAIEAALILKRLRADLEAYIKRHPEWAESRAPCLCLPDAPPVALAMSQAAMKAGVGPMAAVAGAIADAVLDSLVRYGDVLIENGGDCAILSSRNFHASVLAGASPFSGRVAIELPPGRWGLATSSGTLGHAHSFGKADALTVVDSNGSLADAWATARANLVAAEKDLEEACSIALTGNGPLAILAIKGESMAYKGHFALHKL